MDDIIFTIEIGKLSISEKETINNFIQSCDKKSYKINGENVFKIASNTLYQILEQSEIYDDEFTFIFFMSAYERKCIINAQKILKIPDVFKMKCFKKWYAYNVNDV